MKTKTISPTDSLKSNLPLMKHHVLSLRAANFTRREIRAILKEQFSNICKIPSSEWIKKTVEDPTNLVIIEALAQDFNEDIFKLKLANTGNRIKELQKMYFEVKNNFRVSTFVKGGDIKGLKDVIDMQRSLLSQIANETKSKESETNQDQKRKTNTKRADTAKESRDQIRQTKKKNLSLESIPKSHLQHISSQIH